METLGSRIANCRKRKGISQDKLAELIGVSRQTVHKWETNSVQPNADNIISLCKIFKIKSDYLLSDYPDAVEIAINRSIKRDKILLILGICLMAIALLIVGFLTVKYACTAFSVNKGDGFKSTLANANNLFYVMLFFDYEAIKILVLFIVLLVRLNKKAVNKTTSAAA